MARNRFVKNRRAADQLQAQTQYQLALAANAAGAAAAANAVARSGHRHSAAIMPRASASKSAPIVVQHHGQDVLVVNTDYGAAITEFGSRHTPPEAPLRRGAQAAGLTLRDNGQ